MTAVVNGSANFITVPFKKIAMRRIPHGNYYRLGDILIDRLNGYVFVIVQKANLNFLSEGVADAHFCTRGATASGQSSSSTHQAKVCAALVGDTCNRAVQRSAA